MLPCQTCCPDYTPGCHKSCAAWERFQENQRLERQAKKDYLKFYNELCSVVHRQFVALTPHRPAR